MATREELNNKIEAIKRAIRSIDRLPVNSSEQPRFRNRDANNAFRVVVYRMYLQNPVPVVITGSSAKTSYSTNSNYLLGLDVSDRNYRVISEYFRKDKSQRFYPFLTSLYEAIDTEYQSVSADASGYNTLKKNFKSEALVKEYDITPLVISVDTVLGLDEPNTATINMIDPSLIDYNAHELKKIHALNPWLRSVGSKQTLEELKNFRFREYDLVRVYVYNDETKPLSRRISDVKEVIFGKDVLKSTTDSPGDIGTIVSEYCMRPAFTGFSVSMTNSNAVDNPATMSIECTGVSRILSQSSVIMDKSLADQVDMATELAGSISMQRTPVAVESNFFADKLATSAFSYIMQAYFSPTEVFNRRGDVMVMGKPNLKDYIEKLKKEGKLAPNLPEILALHNVKEKFREPMCLCDDYVDTDMFAMFNAVTQTPIRSGVDSLSRVLKPYLTTYKSGMSLWDSSYQSPWELFQTIKSVCFLEIFEDRTGAFHFRFPRYNKCSLDHFFNSEQIISASVNRADSNNFSVVKIRPQVESHGAMPIYSDVYLDPLSIFRYGYRTTEEIHNPLAATASMTEPLAKFMRYYHALKESRTATIVVTGNPRIDVGQMVGFKIGYESAKNPASAQFSGVNKSWNESSVNRVFVGYVTSISENVGVDTLYTQTLNLNYVREAKVERSSLTISRPGTLSDFISNPSLSTTNVYRLVRTGLNQLSSAGVTLASDIASPEVVYPSTYFHINSDDFIMTAPENKVYIGSFDYIDSPLDLANEAIGLSDKVSPDNKRTDDAAKGKTGPAADYTTAWTNLSDIATEARKLIDATVLTVAQVDWLDQMYTAMAVYFGTQNIAYNRNEQQVLGYRTIGDVVASKAVPFDLDTYRDEGFRNSAIALRSASPDPLTSIVGRIDDFMKDTEVDISKDMSIPQPFSGFAGKTTVKVGKTSGIAHCQSTFVKEVTQSFNDTFTQTPLDGLDVKAKSYKLWRAIQVTRNEGKDVVGGQVVPLPSTIDRRTFNVWYDFWGKVIQSTRLVIIDKATEVRKAEAKLADLAETYKNNVKAMDESRSKIPDNVKQYLENQFPYTTSAEELYETTKES